jgi:hypothetical protein
VRGVKKMKVSVNVALYYNYETEIPDDTKEKDLLWACDRKDPVYEDILKALYEVRLNYDIKTISIVREDTDEVIYNI